MSRVNEMIVREYFESLGFLVSQPCKYVPGRRERVEEDFDLIIHNPAQKRARVAEPMVWQTSDVRGVVRAVVAVRGWHTERFYQGTFSQSPDLLKFASTPAVRAASERLGSGEMAKILCLSGLPATPELRNKALAVLKKKGVDGVLEFPTILYQLLGEVDKQRNYEKSDILQVLRIFKSYGMFKDRQMEFFSKKGRKPAKARRPAGQGKNAESTSG